MNANVARVLLDVCENTITTLQGENMFIPQLYPGSWPPGATVSMLHHAGE